jgi:mono/diheme cytochrome c family protein
MMKLLKFLGGAVLLVVVLALGAYLWARQVSNARYQTHWTAHDASFPMPFPLDSAALASLAQERIAAGASAKDPLAGVDLQAAAKERAEARGKHLIESRLGCSSCHGEDFGGGEIINVPAVGYWAAPNLTTGAGSVTNGFSAHDWDLAVRHGIRHTGTSSSMPSTEFLNLSDHELSDVVTYIRSRPPVDRHMAPVRIGPVFAFLIAGDPKMLPPFSIDHQKPHAIEPPPAAVTVEFGAHLVQTCTGCHNPKLSGGKLQGDPNMPIVANITPDSTGLAGWTEADFIRAMREGKRPNGAAIDEHMPWKSFTNMTDVELQALWKYLQSVPPVPKGQQ